MNRVSRDKSASFHLIKDPIPLNEIVPNKIW